MAPYKRPILSKPEKHHPLKSYEVFGQFRLDKDPPWLIPHLDEVMDKGIHSLSKLQAAVDQAGKMDLSELRPEIAAQKRNEVIQKARLQLLADLKRPIERASSNANAATAEILRPTEPTRAKDPVDEMRRAEIRAVIMNMDVKKRKDFCRGNLERIIAIADSPDELLSSETILELRRDFVLKDDPTLADYEKDQRIVYEAIRQRSGQINATAIRILQLSKIDDPVTPMEHYATFQPIGEYEAFLALKKIQEFETEQADEEKRKKFDEDHEGLNMEIGARAARIERGIQH